MAKKKVRRRQGAGPTFERRVCVRMSLWVSGGQEKDLFWRSAMSGGRSTVARKKGVNIRQAGDICSVSPEGHSLTDKFLVECKSYEELRVLSFMFGGTGKLQRMWSKAVGQAADQGKLPLLVAHQVRLPVLFITQGMVWCPYLWKTHIHSDWGEHIKIGLFDDLMRIKYSTFQRRNMNV